MKKTILVFLTALWMFLSGSVALVAGTYGIDEKIMLENSISKQVEGIVVKLLGDKRVMVLVNIDINPTIEQNFEKKENQDGSSAKNNILPAIPQQALYLNTISMQGDYSQIIKLPEFVRSIGVTILLNAKVPDSAVEKVRGYVSGIINLNAARGDKLEIKKMDFVADKDEKKELLINSLITNAPWLIALILMVVFIAGPVKTFLKQVTASMEVLNVRADARIIDKSEVALRLKAGEGMDQIHAGNTIQPIETAAPYQLGSGIQPVVANGQHRFGFINESNINNLIYLLKTEDPESIAIVLTYISKEYSNVVLDSLPESSKFETLKFMAMIKQYQSADIDIVENRLKDKVNYLLGGPQNIADLINTCEPSLREKILFDLAQKDPAVSDQIRGMLVTIEDLGHLSKEHLYELFKIIGTRLFAVALLGVTEDIKSYVLNNLSEGSSKMLKQEMSLIPSAIAPSRVIQAKKDIIHAMKKLETQGLIKIHGVPEKAEEPKAPPKA